MQSLEDTTAAESALLNLKPLRDLAQNWDIDIASCLQDYLEELANVGHPVPHSKLSSSILLSQDVADLHLTTTAATTTTSTTTTTTTVEEGAATTAVNTSMSKTSSMGTNFAQAALLLQNSSFVYSRKVEYLHALVYAALHELIASTSQMNSSKNQNKQNSNTRIHTADKDIERFEAFDPSLDFLLLDDVLPIDTTGDKIDLKSKDDETISHHDPPHLETQSTQRHDGRHEIRTPATQPHHLTQNNNNMTASFMTLGTTSVSRIEPSFFDIVTGRGRTSSSTGTSALLASASARAIIDDLLKGTGAVNRATSTTGGVSGKNDKDHDRFLYSHSQKTTGISLLHGICDLHENGALLMPGSSTIDLGDRRPSRHPTMDHPIPMLHFSKSSPSHPDLPSDTHANPSWTQDLQDPNMYHGDDDSHDDHDDGMGFVMNDDPMDTREDPLLDPTGTNRNPRPKRHVTFTESYSLLQKQDTNIIPPTIKQQDPWMMLDPHDAGVSTPCPIRLGRTYSLPPGIEELPSDAVTGTRTKILPFKNTKKKQSKNQRDHSNRLARKKFDFIATATFDYILSQQRQQEQQQQQQQQQQEEEADDSTQNTKKQQESDETIKEHKDTLDFYSLIPMKGLIFGEEFAYIAKSFHTQKQLERKEARKRRLSQGIDSNAPSNVKNEHLRDLYEMDDNNDDDDDHVGCVFASNDDDNCDEENGDATAMNGKGMLNPPSANISLQQFDDVFGPEEANNNDGSSGHHCTFEELCRAHLKEFVKGVERFVLETQLSKRVSAWQEALALILHEEDNRSPFDIHEYESTILVNMTKNIRISTKDEKHQADNDIKFTSVATGSEKYEICRSFMATLMLCNSGNVSFANNEAFSNNVASPDSLKLKLLKETLESPIDGYFAPSLLMGK